MTLADKLALPKVKVDMGCGFIKKTSEEWVWLDKDERVEADIHCDFSNIPFDDNSVDEIRASDVIEHIPQWRYDEVFKEWSRILKMGGKISGAVPNIHSTMMRYANNELSLSDALGAIYGSGENKFQVHYNGFTVFTLTDLLWKYGFEFVDFSESPGDVNPHLSWWLVFTGTKNREL
jgi:SAM-dependent methyltransferase